MNGLECKYMSECNTGEDRDPIHTCVLFMRIGLRSPVKTGALCCMSLVHW
jgi:hypothetical protein